MAEVRAWTLAGEPVLIDAERALVWPRAATVFVADLHLGKDQVLREAGVALPDGTLAADLARLGRIVDRHAARNLVILGDLVHGRTAPQARWIATFGAWLAARPGLAVRLVAGNHDRALPDWPTLGRLRDGEGLGPFVLRHAPATSRRGHVLAGHLHPGVRLRDRHAPGVRLPAFWLGPARTVLPAFGDLTGLARAGAEPSDRIVACAEGRLVEVTPAGPRPARRGRSRG
jgi:DNA ligase-associated metallophosphoesterase